VFERFISELRRRGVLQLAGIYLVAAWAIIQVADAMFEPLHIPPWVHTFVIVLLLIGFPFALVLAWTFELTARGVVREEPADAQRNWAAWPYLVFAVALVSVGASLWLIGGVGSGSNDDDTAASPSIAVLSFNDLSQNGENASFTAGLTEALLQSVARVPGLRLASRTSSFAYKDVQSDIREIGRALGVANVLEGSVRKSGDQIKISATLISVKDGYELWSHSYDARLDDIFRIQDEISLAIAEALKVRLIPGELPLPQPDTADVSAYEMALQGRGLLRSAELEEDYLRAIDLFGQAVARDPAFGDAYAGLCSAYWHHYRLTRDTESVELALDKCARAQVLDPNSVAVQLALGWLCLGTGRTDAALTAFHEAVDIQPGSDEAHRGLAATREQMGEIETAEAGYRKAIELSPQYWRNYADLAVFLARQGRFREAADAYHTSIDLNPENPLVWASLGGTHFMLGEFAEAAAAFRSSLFQNPTANGYSNAGTNYYYAGQYRLAREMFQRALELKPSDYRLVGNLADACRMLDDCKAGQYYWRALELAAAQSQVQSNDPVLLALRAWYQSNLGLSDAARQSIRRAEEFAADNIDAQWVMGLAWQALGEHERARASIAQAVTGGYAAALVHADPDLKGVAEAVARQD